MSAAADTATATTRVYGGAGLEERRADQRRRLLEGARDAFVAKGYAATSVDDVVARARTSRTAFYRLFSNKEDCLLELYRDATAELAIALLRASESASDPVQRVRAGIEALTATLAADRATAHVMLIEVVGATPAVETARVEARARFAAIIASELGSVPGWEDRSDGERELVSLATMGAVAEVLAGMAARGTLLTDEAVAEHLAAYALRALTPPA